MKERFVLKTILLDCDGVLADFHGAALKLWDFPREQYPPGVYDIPGVVGISEDDFWERINSIPDFWLDIPAFAWLEELIRFVDRTGIKWYIATAPSLDPDCVRQKIIWLRRRLGNKFNRIMLGRHKELMANPQTVLIDDCDANIDRFIRREGHGILFPQVWNARHQEIAPFSAVTRELEALIAKVP